MYNGSYFSKVTVALDNTKPILLTGPTDENWSSIKADVILSLFPGTQIINLGRNRWDKFKRENPTTKEFGTFYRSEFMDKVKSVMTADEIAAANLCNSDREFARNHKNMTFDDPKLNEIIRVAQCVDNPNVIRYNHLYGRNYESYTEGWYPLMDHRHKEHNKIYADAIYGRTNK
jgi:hypothetical protein